MELTPEQLRDVHDMASHTIAESELPRVVRERDACREALRPFAAFITNLNRGRPDDETFARAAKPGTGGAVIEFMITAGDCRRAAAAIALCEQPKPESQPCPTPPTDPTA